MRVKRRHPVTRTSIVRSNVSIVRGVKLPFTSRIAVRDR